MFKNLITFKLAGEFTRSASDIESRLADFAHAPPTGLQSQSQGWLPVGPTGRLVHSVDQDLLLCLGIEKKVLPASAVKNAVAAKAADLLQERGFLPGRKLLRELKDQVLVEMLPKALTTQSSTLIRICGQTNLVMIGTSSTSRAEAAVEFLRQMFGSFETRWLDPEISAPAAMHAWLQAGHCSPEGLEIGDCAVLTAPDIERATVRFSNHSLAGSAAVQSHLGTKICVSMGLTHREQLSFVLDDRLRLTKLQLLLDSETGDDEDPVSKFEADARLWFGAIDAAVASIRSDLKF